MPRERSDMRRVKELLRLAHELGYSKRQIALSIRMPKTTVGDYLARATAAGLCYADVAGMREEAVEALLFQRAELPERRPMPDWQWVSAELCRRGVTLMLVWEEYRQQHRDGYSSVSFGTTSWITPAPAPNRGCAASMLREPPARSIMPA